MRRRGGWGLGRAGLGERGAGERTAPRAVVVPVVLRPTRGIDVQRPQLGIADRRCRLARDLRGVGRADGAEVELAVPEGVVLEGAPGDGAAGVAVAGLAPDGAAVAEPCGQRARRPVRPEGCGRGGGGTCRSTPARSGRTASRPCPARGTSPSGTPQSEGGWGRRRSMGGDPCRWHCAAAARPAHRARRRWPPGRAARPPRRRRGAPWCASASPKVVTQVVPRPQAPRPWPKLLAKFPKNALPSITSSR